MKKIFSSAKLGVLYNLPSFWQCALKPVEIALLALGFLGALALHLDPVLNSGLAKPLLFALGVLCFLSPVSGFFFLAACAILPTASAEQYALARFLEETGDSTGGMIDSGTKYAFYSWVLAVPLRYQRLRLRGIGVMWPILPWLLWMMLTNGIRNAISPDLIKSLLFCVMACQLANEAKGQYLKCLLGMGLGFCVITIGFWANAAGLPVQLADWGGDRSGFTRRGSVVADSVMLWPPLLCGLGVMLGVAAGYGSRFYRGQPATWASRSAMFYFMFSLPPLLAAMTNSGVFGLVLLLSAYVASLSHSSGTGQTARSRNSDVFMMLGALLVGAALMFATNAMDSRKRLTGLFEYYMEQSETTGVAASRDSVWDASIDTITRYPLFGVHFSGGKEKIPAEYAAKGYYLSHNVFLDYGRSAGIPGMLLFAYFFFWPVIRFMKTGKYLPYMGFLLAHCAYFIFLLSLSFQWYKSLWAFWMLAAMTASRVDSSLIPARAKKPSRRSRTGREMSIGGLQPVRQPTGISESTPGLGCHES